MKRKTAAGNPRFAVDAKYDISEGRLAGFSKKPAFAMRIETRPRAIRRSIGRRSLRPGTAMAPVSVAPTRRRAPYPVRHRRVQWRTPRLQRLRRGESGAPRISTISSTRVCIRTVSWFFLNKGTITNTSAVLAALGGAATNSPLGTGYTSICDRTGGRRLLHTLRSGTTRRTDQSRVRHVELWRGELEHLWCQCRGQRRCARRSDQGDQRGAASVIQTRRIFCRSPRAMPPLGTNVVNPSCYLTPDILAFSNGGGSPNSYKRVAHQCTAELQRALRIG